MQRERENQSPSLPGENQLDLDLDAGNKGKRGYCQWLQAHYSYLKNSTAKQGAFTPRLQQEQSGWRPACIPETRKEGDDEDEPPQLTGDVRRERFQFHGRVFSKKFHGCVATQPSPRHPCAATVTVCYSGLDFRAIAAGCACVSLDPMLCWASPLRDRRPLRQKKKTAEKFGFRALFQSRLKLQWNQPSHEVRLPPINGISYLAPPAPINVFCMSRPIYKFAPISVFRSCKKFLARLLLTHSGRFCEASSMVFQSHFFYKFLFGISFLFDLFRFLFIFFSFRIVYF